MEFEYEEKFDKQFPYWLTYRIPYDPNNLWFFIDINQWVSDQVGPIGVKWGWEKSTLSPGTNIHSSKVEKPQMWYSWRFKDKDDAMHFKLRWV